MRKVAVNANADPSFSPHFVINVVSAITDTHNVDPAIVILMELAIMSAKLAEANVPANITMPEIIATSALKAISISPNAHVIFSPLRFPLRTYFNCLFYLLYSMPMRVPWIYFRYLRY